MKQKTLYITATPIGNMGDITQRAIETLREVDLILCEDTTKTQKLLNHFDINTKTESFHTQSREKKILDIYEFLQQGNSAALVSDAGTPGINDPGGKLVEYLYQRGNINILPIPGPSAVTTALSVSGFPANEFVFLGFAPNKKGRKSFFKEAVEYDKTVVFFESKHRIKKTLKELEEIMDPNRKLCVCRELTKKFETVYRGNIEQIQKEDIKKKGEFTIIIDSRSF